MKSNTVGFVTSLYQAPMAPGERRMTHKQEIALMDRVTIDLFEGAPRIHWEVLSVVRRSSPMATHGRKDAA